MRGIGEPGGGACALAGAGKPAATSSTAAPIRHSLGPVRPILPGFQPASSRAFTIRTVLLRGYAVAQRGAPDQCSSATCSQSHTRARVVQRHVCDRRALCDAAIVRRSLPLVPWWHHRVPRPVGVVRHAWLSAGPGPCGQARLPTPTRQAGGEGSPVRICRLRMTVVSVSVTWRFGSVSLPSPIALSAPKGALQGAGQYAAAGWTPIDTASAGSPAGRHRPGWSFR